MVNIEMYHNYMGSTPNTLQIEYATYLKRLEQVKEQTVSDYKWKIRTVEEVGEVAKGKHCFPKEGIV